MDHPGLPRLADFSRIREPAGHSPWMGFSAPAPSDLDCGQTSDDAAEVAALLRGESPVVLWHDLEHIAGLLQLLARLDLPSVS
jgi:hypothetical protein